MSAAITVSGVSKTFRFSRVPRGATLKDFVVRAIRMQGDGETVNALNDVSFSVERGSMLGVVGRNGSGKTTLMRILAGILAPDRGNVAVNGTLAPLLALGTGFHPDLTGREGARIELLAMGRSPRELPRMLDAIVAFSEIGDFVDAPVRTYSAGMLMRLAFSVAISVDPDVLLIDEILSVGDEAFSRKCYACLDDFRARQKTIVVVTHNAGMVWERCDHALWLDKGKIAGLGEAKMVVSEYHALTEQAAHTLHPVL